MAEARETAAAHPAGSERLTLAATILASALGFIDGSIVGIALPAIARDLGAGFDTLQWAVGGYLLTLSACLAVGGALGDRLGRKRVFLAGIALFTLASLACALAPSAEWLVGARVAQGFGAAAMVPQSLAILAATFPRERRGRAIAFWASASALTTVIGPILGGALVEGFGWRSVFWINLPLAAVTIAITLAGVAESRAPVRDGAPDYLGALTLVLGLGALAWSLIAGPERGFDLSVSLALAAGLALLTTFPRIEARAAAPIAPPELFRAPGFAAVNLATVLLWGALGAAMFLMPIDFVSRRGFSEAEVGLMMTPFALVIAAVSRVSGQLGDRFGPRAPMTAGALLFALACVSLAVAPAVADYGTTLLPAILGLGLGVALVTTPLTTMVFATAPDAYAGLASGVNNTAARAAGLLAVAAVGALAAAYYAADAAAVLPGDRLGDAVARGAASDPALRAAFGRALTAGYLACAALALAAAVVMARLRRPSS